MKWSAWKQKSLFLFFALCIVLSSFGTAFAAESTGKQKQEPGYDVAGHWAEQVLKDWLGKGLITGFEDGSVKPNRDVTRAEFVTLVNKSQGLTAQAAIAFKDVKEGNWFYGEVAKAQQGGYISGYSDQTFKPNKQISRQEAAVILAKLLKLQASESAGQLSDVANAPAWSKGSIGAVIDAGLMIGDKGKFRPADNLTRAEAVTLLDRALAYDAAIKPAVTYDKAGSYGDKSTATTVYGSALISVPGVTLNNIVIEGDLVIGEGVGQGDVYLNQVTVKGKTTILGGGKNSIHLSDSVLLTVIVDKRDGSIRIVAEGSTTVQQITLQSGARLEESQMTGSGFGDVVLSSVIPQGSEVSMAGRFNSVDVIATSIKLDLTQGSIEQLNVTASATGTDVNIAASARVAALILNAVTNVTGQGSIGTATINASGSSIAQTPERVIVGNGVNATVGGQPAVSTPANSGSGGSGGSPSIPDTVYGFTGKIVDANNQPVPDMHINFRRGVEAKTGDIAATVVTDANGEYFADLRPGVYTGELVKPGFLVTFIIGTSLTGEIYRNKDEKAVRIPNEGEIRIVLTWGENPRDEDSHLLGPTVDGLGHFHTWYGGKDYKVNSTTYADLDIDDTESYGPETTTIRYRTDGFYQFYVHHFAGISTLRKSGAKVDVYVGSVTSPTISYSIPEGDGTEIYWDVFAMNILNGEVTFIDRNTMRDDEPQYEGEVNPALAELSKFQSAEYLIGTSSVNGMTYLMPSIPLNAGTSIRLSDLVPASTTSVTYATYVGINETGDDLVINDLNTSDNDLDFRVKLTVTVGNASASKVVGVKLLTVRHYLEYQIAMAQLLIENESIDPDVRARLQDLTVEGNDLLNSDASVTEMLRVIQEIKTNIFS
ncbi:S-layer homology domain-containing protein [Cohnella sp. REN36]|uniref:S-layer homology domain-containing protein n=1 Tax=Cohnella sp. REN36 TaxID=2887347 RepID=UPI001D152B2C|nr:S-layer homology domain-containing protein [Cohnella sp. REN36]MCC3372710.1 S-layer homology domain-containing protein [Cohnella sp. REN36]